jgi:hypothetical protein
MSDYYFTDGNLIVLYVVHNSKPSKNVDELPDYIMERVKVGLETYNSVMRSKPDKHKTMVMIVGEQEIAEKVKAVIIERGVNPEIIAIDTDSENISQTIDRVYKMIRTRPNPPFIYFVSSVWLQDIFNSTALSKMKGYKAQFYGALDHRPVKEVEIEKAMDVAKKGREYYKQTAKNKAADVLLNLIFRD